MKLTVLVDNNTLIDEYYLGEPGLSFLLEDDDKTILFDTGYSNILLSNAEKMGIDLKKIDTIVLSHGHNDHTGGLVYLNDYLKQNIKVIAHPDVDNHKEHNGLDISMPLSLTKLNANFEVIRTKEIYKISEHLTYLGQIERTIQPLRKLGDDPLYDDSALVYHNDDYIYIITGCSHSGICNIVEKAMTITGCQNVKGIIGGFHILENEVVENEVSDYLEKVKPEEVYCCHCTDLHAKIHLAKSNSVKEVGVGLVINI